MIGKDCELHSSEAVIVTHDLVLALGWYPKGKTRWEGVQKVGLRQANINDCRKPVRLRKKDRMDMRSTFALQFRMLGN